MVLEPSSMGLKRTGKSNDNVYLRVIRDRLYTVYVISFKVDSLQSNALIISAPYSAHAQMFPGKMNYA